MTEGTPIGEALEGYAVMFQALIDDWTPYLDGLSTKVSSGTYGPDDVTAEFPALVKLVAESMIRVGSEAADALAILNSDFDETTEVEYDVEGALKVTGEVTLALTGDLKSVSGEILPQAYVKVVPATAVAPHLDFVLEVDGTGEGFKARTYDGYVRATDASGAVEDFFVSRTIG